MFASVNSDNVTSKRWRRCQNAGLIRTAKSAKKEKVSECCSHSLIEDKSIEL
jgi:hypothetical protein